MESINLITEAAVNPQPRASMDMAQVEKEIEARRALYRRRIDSMVTAIEEGVVYKQGPAPLKIWQKRYFRFPAGHYNFALLSLRLVYRKNVHQIKDRARFEYVNRLLFESIAAATVSAQNILVYYKTKDARELPQGLIYLPHITAVDVVSTKKQFAFRIRTLTRDFNFATRNASEADAWVLAIKQRIQMNLPSVKNSPAYIQSYQQLVEGTGFSIKSEAQDEDEDEVFSGSEMDIGRISQEQSIVFDSFTNSQYGLPNKTSVVPKEVLSRPQRSFTLSPPLPEKRTSFQAFKNIFRKGSLSANTKFGPGIGNKAFQAGEGASKAFASTIIPEEKSHEIETPITISPDSTPGYQNISSRASDIVESLNETPIFISSLHALNAEPISNEATNAIPTPIPETNFEDEHEVTTEENQEEQHDSNDRLIFVEKEVGDETEDSSAGVSKNDGYRTFFLRLIPESSERIELNNTDIKEDEFIPLESSENKASIKSKSELQTTEKEIKDADEEVADESLQSTSDLNDHNFVKNHTEIDENLEPVISEEDNTSDLNNNMSSKQEPKESINFLSRLLSLGSRIKSPKLFRQPDTIDEIDEEITETDENYKLTLDSSEVAPASEDINNAESTVNTISPNDFLNVPELEGVNSNQPPNSPSDQAEPLPLSPAPLPEPGLVEYLEGEDIAFSSQHMEVDECGELDVGLKESQETILEPSSNKIQPIDLIEETIETFTETEEITELTTDASSGIVEADTPLGIGKTDASSGIEEAGNYLEIEKTDASSEIEEAGVSLEVEEVETSPEAEENNASLEIEENNTSQEIEESDAFSGIKEIDASPEVIEINISPETDASQSIDEADTSQEIEVTDAYQEIKDDGASHNIEETDAQQKINEAVASKEIEETAASQEIDENNASLEIEKTDASLEIKETHTCKETEKDDALKETEEIDALKIKETDTCKIIEQDGASKELEENQASTETEEDIKANHDTFEENKESIIPESSPEPVQPVAESSAHPLNIETLVKVSLEAVSEIKKPDASQPPTHKRQSTLMSLFNNYTQPASNPSTNDIHPHYIELSKDANYANFIYKQSYYFHNSNLRFAILSPTGVFTYYRSATTITDGKSIPLDVTCSTETLTNTKFSIITPTSTYYFEARSELERNSWLQAINYFTSA